MPDKKVQLIMLTTHTKAGNDCVERVPPRVVASRKDVDTIRLINSNPAGSELTITVSIDPRHASNLFNPVPDEDVDLDPGDSVDWIVKSGLTGTVSLKFETDPDTCHAHDQDDVIVKFDGQQ